MTKPPPPSRSKKKSAGWLGVATAALTAAAASTAGLLKNVDEILASHAMAHLAWFWELFSVELFLLAGMGTLAWFFWDNIKLGAISIRNLFRLAITGDAIALGISAIAMTVILAALNIAWTPLKFYIAGKGLLFRDTALVFTFTSDRLVEEGSLDRAKETIESCVKMRHDSITCAEALKRINNSIALRDDLAERYLTLPPASRLKPCYLQLMSELRMPDLDPEREYEKILAEQTQAENHLTAALRDLRSNRRDSALGHFHACSLYAKEFGFCGELEQLIQDGGERGPRGWLKTVAMSSESATLERFDGFERFPATLSAAIKQAGCNVSEADEGSADDDDETTTARNRR